MAKIQGLFFDQLMWSSLTLALLALTFSALADNYFNPRLLSDDPSLVADLSLFEKGLEAPPGTYRVDIYVNDNYITAKDIAFKQSDDGKSLEPCLSLSQLSSLGVNTLAIPDAAMQKMTCVPFTHLIAHASSQFDVGQQRLYLSFPQAFMDHQTRDYVAPGLLDNGITAGVFNYDFNSSQVRSADGNIYSHAYLNLRSGINMGAWRLRDNLVWSYSSGAGGHENRWQQLNGWLERGIISWKSQLKIGDGDTDNTVFDSVNFRGIDIRSDDNMLPESEKGFAPVIHGIARTTANVSVKQNGYEIYQITVPPGAFTINDLYAVGGSGDLEVTIKESDGSTQVFTVPYSSVPLLLRQGSIKYSVTAGQYRSGNEQQNEPFFFQATVLRGLSNGFTSYGGIQVSNHYNALNIGVSKNIGYLGALSVNITQAKATLADNSQHEGQSLRLLYSKSINQWGTELQCVLRYDLTPGFYSLGDTAWKHIQGNDSRSPTARTHNFADDYNLNYSQRDRLAVTVSQKIGEASSFYLTGSHEGYWKTKQSDDLLQFGYSSNIKNISWNISYSLAKNAWISHQEQLFSLNFTIPLNYWLQSDNHSSFRNSSINFSTSNDFKDHSSSRVGMSGSLLDGHNLNYSVQSGYNKMGANNTSTTWNTALNYSGAYGMANLGYSHSKDSDQLYYGVNGGVLVHGNGITLSQPLSDTVVLIKAPGAKNVSIQNQTGIHADWRGYAVLPYAMEYHENKIALNVNSLENDIELEEPILSVFPTRGAVVIAEFKTRIGTKALMTLLKNGKPVPFGSVVSYGDDGQSSGIVADGGQVYLTGLSQHGQVQVKWGNDANDQCTAEYSLPDNAQQQLLNYISAECY